MTIPLASESARALLQRGYPHLRELVSDHPDDAPKRVAKAAAKSVNVIDPIYHVRWPRVVASRFVRMFATIRDRKKRHERAGEDVSEPTAEEAREWAEHVVRDGVGRHVYRYDVHDFFLLLEAFVGVEPVLEGYVAGLEAWVDEYAKRWGGSSGRAPSNYLATYGVIPLGALLLRANSATRGRTREALEKLLDTHKALVPVEWSLWNLVMLLRGRQGVIEAQAKWAWHLEAYLFSDDPAYVRESVAKLRGEEDIDARVIFLGGEPVLDAYLPYARKVRAADAAHVVEGLAMFATPRVAPLMLALAVKKSPEAIAWLTAHPQLAGPTLEAAVRAGKKDAALAAELLGGGAPTVPKKKATPAQIERSFDRLIDDVVKAITAVRGDAEKEAEAWRDATAGYMEIRSAMDEPATEYMGHFFMVDGVGREKSRRSAWERLEPTDEEGVRWSDVISESQ